MKFSNIKLFSLSLIACAAASPVKLQSRGQNVIIGYRVVSPAQAQRYNDAGTLTDDGNLISAQLGPGVYTTPGRAQWPGPGDGWHCVILVDSDALDRVSKAWVPETYDDITLWYDSGAIDTYIQKLDDSWDPAKTLRMSKLNGFDFPQLSIPPGLLNSNGGAMGIIASCKATVDEIPDSTVNYDDWQNNIKGDRDPGSSFDGAPFEK